MARKLLILASREPIPDRLLEVLDAARTALLGRRNILVSGGTGSGKTTLLNALVELLPADDRIVSIEDTLELRIDRKNCVRFEARGIDGESVTIRDLVKHALRHRPDHIVVGEVRGGEAADLLQALNTGHGGSLTTIHANNAESALSRLATCAMQGETDLPWEVTCRGVVDGISMVIHMTRREGKRYVEEALHVGDYDAAKRRWHYRPVAFADPQLKLAAGAVMPDNAARTMRLRRAGIVRAMLLLVRGYNAAKNLCLTAPIWSVKHDKDMEACEDMNDKSKPALSLVTPQARHHFTLADQVNQLVGASEADPEMGFMTRLMALCSLPRSNPGDRYQYTRINGPYKLIMSRTGDYKLPFGHIPRLLLGWVCTEAVRTQSPRLVLGKTLSDFMRVVGIDPAGASYARVRNQMKRLFSCSVVLIYTGAGRESQVNTLFVDRTDFWWTDDKPGSKGQNTIELSHNFFNEIIHHPVPLDLHILKALSRCSLGLDLYQWLNYRTFALDRPLRVSWTQIYRQFAQDPSRAHSKHHVAEFRRDVLRGATKDQDSVAGPGLCHASGNPGIVTNNNSIRPAASISSAPTLNGRVSAANEDRPN